MEEVTGRVADFLMKCDHTRVAGISLIENTLTRFAGLVQMQIIQEDVDLFEVRLVVGPAYTEQTKIDLIVYLQSVFGHDVQVNIVLLEEIHPEKNGKFRFSICKVK